MTTTGDRTYLGAPGGNNGLFSNNAVAGSYPFVAGNNNVPGNAAQTPALVQMADGMRLQGTITQQQPPNNPRQGQGDQNFIQQGVSPVGVGSAPTDNTLEDTGQSGVGTPLAAMANGQQEHGVAVHSVGY